MSGIPDRSGPDATWDVPLADEEATRRLAADLALAARPGDLLALQGDLGAGKSTLARAFLRALARDPELEVPSPTYTLVQLYDTQPPAAHADLYRLGDEAEIEELGLVEVLEDGILLVEWPERAPSFTRHPGLRIRLRDAAGGGRVAHIESGHASAATRFGRTLAARRFLEEAGHGRAWRAPLGGDASARGYETVTVEAGAAPLILMDSPDLVPGPPVRGGRPYAAIAHLAQTLAPFVAIAGTLRDHGLLVPDVLHADTRAGFALLSDLGRDGVLDAGGRPIPERYEATVDALAHLHAQPFAETVAGPDGPYRIPPFDRDAMAIEISLLLDWYWPDRYGQPASPDDRAAFDAAWAPLLDLAEDAEHHLLLRDVHSPNLLWQPGEEGIRRIALLDFQDAMIGPTAYDVASLAQDARVTVEPELEARLIARYCAARRRHDPAFDAFRFEAAYAVMSAQRLTKILGIFVRLHARDGKPQYRRHIPRLKQYLKRTLPHPALAPLAELYGRWRLLDEDGAPS
ncbi:tRNA (adenosine(37)-N6)-threonylcarbamoyltransferase complex ATPase subunit type 1 TsaE [Aureimonas sp. AU4]|uniref:tRNA (adenosine(37)-N6)-threonylcarbamoyltransferase complex ATPase subunit type 1 TsaE n=1 Tax=Aureimonas sp. AU4 TaxID=1638163 RepID=UPI000782B80D|nr:tRNA (adenosine(37)-N6)-threonylcarbamoyltransferase complex ATPase subunit type 1 TsaE [Aureimonas sp. AU4]